MSPQAQTDGNPTIPVRVSNMVTQNDVPAENSNLAPVSTRVLYTCLEIFIQALNGFSRSPFFDLDVSLTSQAHFLKNSLLPQSGDIKSFNRSQYERSTTSRKRNKIKTLAKLSKKSWTPERKEAVLKLENSISQAVKTHPKLNQYLPQAGVAESFPALHASLRELGSDVSDTIWSRVEAAILLTASLTECKSNTQALSIVLLYLKSEVTNKSLFLSASAFITELFSPDALDPQAGLSMPDWITDFRQCMDNWHLLVKLPVFKHISVLLSALVTLGICDATSMEWNVGSVRVFSAHMAEKHVSAFDIVDATIETVFYFVECGHLAIQTGSVAPFLYSDREAIELDTEYSFLVANAMHAKTGNMRKLAGIDDNDFSKRLHDAIDRFRSMHRNCTLKAEKRVLEIRLQKLELTKAHFTAARVAGGIREAPYAVSISGRTGVGKSSLASITMSVILKSNDFDSSDDRIVTLNDGDKYMSNYRSDVNGIHIDDVSNMHQDYVSEPTTNKVVEIVNNVPMNAIMADIDQKGVVSVEPKALVVTTNMKDMKAHVYSHEPCSVLRRVIHVTAKVRTKFCAPTCKGITQGQLDPTLVEKHHTDENGIVNIPDFPDLWLVTVEKCVPISQALSENDAVSFQPFNFEGEDMVDVGIATYVRFLIAQSRLHFHEQKQIVSRHCSFSAKWDMCKHGLPTTMCFCGDLPAPLDVQSGIVGFVMASAVNKTTKYLYDTYVPSFKAEFLIVEKAATTALFEEVKALEESLLLSWTGIIPTTWFNNPLCKRMIHYAYRRELRKRAAWTMSHYVILIVVAAIFGFFYFPALLIFVPFLAFQLMISVRVVKEQLIEELAERNDALPVACKNVRDKHAKVALLAMGVFASAYYVLRVFKLARGMAQPQGNLSPESDADIATRDSEVDPWASVNISPLPSSPKLQCQTNAEAVERTSTNLVYIRFPHKGEEYVVGGMFIQSNVMVVPKHFFFEKADLENGKRFDEMRVHITRTDRKKVGSSYDAILSSSSCVDVPDSDFVLCYVPKGGSYKDLSWCLPDSTASGQHSFVWRGPDGLIVNANAHCEVGPAAHKYAAFQGGHSTLDISTQNGMCMAAYVSKGKANCITGFHLAGKSDTPNGAFGTLTKADYNTCYERLMKVPGILRAKSAGTLLDVQYGVNTLLSVDVHHKCPTNFLPASTCLDVYGSSSGRASYYSKVVPTVISSSVAEVCDMPCKHGRPKNMNSWVHWHKCLSDLANPTIGMRGDHLKSAYVDYIVPLQAIIKNNDFVCETIKPLTEMETICGIDGRRFIDAMKASTAVGFPLTGPKSSYMTMLDPDDYPDQACPIELDPMFGKEVEHLEMEYLEGRRGYTVYKASLKDEPVALTKDKVRVFQAAPLVAQIIIRKYYLPIVRLLSLYPLVSEIAVGINAQGPEWNDSVEHMDKFGSERIFAGDYSKYDLRMPAQLVAAAFQVLIDLAKATGNYTAKDISIMEGIATDIVYPVVAYNGTLIQLYGSNPSGHNLTVYINSIVNALLQRSFAASIAFEDVHYRVPFRQFVSTLNYGDDVRGSVKQGFDKFNITAFSEFLAEYGMLFTMPDKSSALRPYMRSYEADFLKRKALFNEELGIFMGPLDEDSIFKSLHCVIQSSFLSEEEAACANIEGAIREWFFHGREVFEKRRAQMIRVADECDLVIPFLSETYNDHMLRWKSKYLPPDETGLPASTDR